MSQTRLYLTAPRKDAERIFAALETEFEDDGLPLAMIEQDEERDLHELSLYAEDDAEQAAERMQAVLADLDLDMAIERETLPDVDWVALSLEGLKPVRAGRFIVHGSHDRQTPQEGEIAIEIEAGLAFGTGHHGTTSGCLEMIEKVVGSEQSKNALDLGTGSAVLAIGLARLAGIPVLATDIDPVATKVAADNARLNGVSDLVETHTASGFDDPIFAARGPFELIVANILAGPLIELAPQLTQHAKAGGSIILSGILERQHDAVRTAYIAQGCRHVETIAREGWVTLYLKR
ncbi:50S ribosomal protein L11 methyltransferase [Pseudaminobacter arsenicus]|uniref:Ribosomal protein L11 methyltransferase n=1 Tax=Borborobacter arsenicus TaxID=1851146 RepID=A0A432VCE2_9HYPH|nr:50S ribosomal protein L11 methyltransferase [Pseudaminobacter arsenicus]RUM99773.1 50S ribosomal protein L11 methyltransferase [Pseudaminobacter arsenicus]